MNDAVAVLTAVVLLRPENPEDAINQKHFYGTYIESDRSHLSHVEHESPSGSADKVATMRQLPFP